MTKILRVLLADDDEDDRELFFRAMSEVDPSVKVTAVLNGDMLMRDLAGMTNLPQLIFLDLNMPLKNGLECLAEIKQNPVFGKVPILIYSTSISPSEVEKAWSLGALCFVRKPDSYQKLKEIISRMINMDLSTFAHQPRENFILSF
ncbi:MAG: response regulator [Cyclobacteriaceae bacterium]|nr:response regulator [Cyclobacteriaceae bacterium]